MKNSKTETVSILLAEDDRNLGNLLKEYLETKGYDTRLAVNGKEAYDLFSKNKFDLCMLDVMMPVKDGFTLAREIRTMDKNVPIVFLTAKSMKEDTIEGFSVGADDYITKPFSMEELLLRITAILRRVKNQTIKQSEQNEFTIGKYKFNYTNRTLELKSKKEELTTKEADLLKLLCINSNDVVDRNFALRTVWQNDSYFSARSMDVYISKLRKYLNEDPKVEILNIHGRGFKLRS
ncbi:MAG TPA: response regulator transcription factor [Bacteroidia bacterium]|nr:response regulator transcription factor [Bacteroidia bacterium]HNO70344.1 response regulator transcription factor [Bacteroidia bacterium]